VTVLDEKKCRELVGKLCSGLGWEVKRVAEMPYVLFTGEDRWCAFGGTWKNLYENFHESSYEFIYPFNDIPRWIRLCSSPEELALKIEVTL
jgi:hypothetical protein